MATKAEATRAKILTAAVTVFSSRALAEVSMGDVAAEAGISRPAIYQYFDDKQDLYRAMLEAILADASRRATDALATRRSLSEALVGFVMAAWGDKQLWRLTRHHGHDLREAKISFARPVVDAHYERLIVELRAALAPHARSTDQLDGWIDLVRYAPLGFTYDQPSRAAYHRRLTALATTIAEAADNPVGDRSAAEADAERSAALRI